MRTPPFVQSASAPIDELGVIFVTDSNSLTQEVRVVIGIQDIDRLHHIGFKVLEGTIEIGISIFEPKNQDECLYKELDGSTEFTVTSDFAVILMLRDND